MVNNIAFDTVLRYMLLLMFFSVNRMHKKGSFYFEQRKASKKSESL